MSWLPRGPFQYQRFIWVRNTTELPTAVLKRSLVTSIPCNAHALETLFLLYHNGCQLSLPVDKTIALTSKALLWAGSCGQQVGAYLRACGNIRLVNNANKVKHSASPPIFACWGPQGKLHLLGRIYIFYSWGGHHFHFPESQSLPIFQSTSFGSKLTPWFGLSGKGGKGKWQDISDKLRDEATTGIDKGAGKRVSAVLLGDAGGWHWQLERCWWCWVFCFVFAGSLPVSIMQKIKKEEEKFLLPSPPAQISESQVFFTGILETEFATLHSNLK